MRASKIYLFIVILVFSFFLRTQNSNWDQGFHLHPDERAIVLYTLPLNLPHTLSEFFSSNSAWNPHFFAYGSFPLYLLKTSGSFLSTLDPNYSSYQNINLIGRFISAFFDIGTLILLFLIAKKIFNEVVGFISIFLYGTSVLPIQLSHFYTVDTILTFFISFTIYRLILFYEKPTFKNGIKTGIVFGFALATKISAVVLIASIGSAIAVDFILLILNKPRPKHWFPYLPAFIKKLFKEMFLIAVFAASIFAILEPYALIDVNSFLNQTLVQNRMTENAFTFPYTLQYVGKTPYLYELKNIFLFGLGPIAFLIALAGTVLISFDVAKRIRQVRNQKLLIVLVFFWIYFFVVGKFAIGFMRYILPLYPFLCLFGANFVHKTTLFLSKRLSKNLFAICYLLFAISLLVWPLSFLNIYSRPNTRVLASFWINENIPHGSTLAIEHWDDAIPLFGQQKYQIETLELYNPDTETKWNKINQQLAKTQYIILASNRLYVPLQKLTDCPKLPALYCYPKTAQYYKSLFNGKLGFKKVAEFSVEPKFGVGKLNFEFNDQSADESFTVYDHPKVMIFKKSP